MQQWRRSVAPEVEIDIEEVKTAFKQAAAIAEAVPTSMQGAAFGRALDLLMGHAPTPHRSQSKRGKTRSQQAGKPTRGTNQKTPARRTSKPGARAAIRKLIQTDFFKAPRVIGDMQRHLETTQALKFSQQNISPELVALVRKGELARKKNAQGVYEYRLT